jgi:hypothetical protein
MGWDVSGEQGSGTWENITKSCHSEPFAVILSEAKDLALDAQGKLREESAVVRFQKDKSRFFASLRMTDDIFTASFALGYSMPPLMGLRNTRYRQDRSRAGAERNFPVSVSFHECLNPWAQS